MANVVQDQLDVICIFIVPKMTVEELAASRSTTVKRSHSDVGKVEVRASKLRKCSTYFDACMSERWAESESDAKTFRLEAQTEVKHYEDCFARMSRLDKPIASVKNGIELLKVASQIGFQAAVDIGVKYLAAAPWSDDEEALVRDFCSSPHVTPCESLCDLMARLEDLPPGAAEKQEKRSLAAMKLLSLLLLYAIPIGRRLASEILKVDEKCPMPAKRTFAIAFHRIMSGAESGSVSERVVEFLRALVTQEALRLMEEISRNAVSLDPLDDALGPLYKLLWLFKVAQHSSVEQEIVELLVGDVHVLSVIRVAYFEDEADEADEAEGALNAPDITLSAVKKLAQMVYTVMEDVMAGKLFLRTAQRVALFVEGRWLLCARFMNRDKPFLAVFLNRFLATLPQRLQEDCWTGAVLHDSEGPPCEAYAMWFSHMVTLKAQRQPDFPTTWPSCDSSDSD